MVFVRMSDGSIQSGSYNITIFDEEDNSVTNTRNSALTTKTEEIRESGEYMLERVDDGLRNDVREHNIYPTNDGIALKNDEILKDKHVKKFIKEKIYYLSRNGEWKVEVTDANTVYKNEIKTYSSRPIHSKKDWIDFRRGSSMKEKYNDIIEAQKQRYEDNLEKSMENNKINSVNLDHIHTVFQKLTVSSGASHIDFPDWIRVKKAVINPKNNDDTCFQYAVTLALSWEKIRKNCERVNKILPYAKNYEWGDITFPIDYG